MIRIVRRKHLFKHLNLNKQKTNKHIQIQIWANRNATDDKSLWKSIEHMHRTFGTEHYLFTFVAFLFFVVAVAVVG